MNAVPVKRGLETLYVMRRGAIGCILFSSLFHFESDSHHIFGLKNFKNVIGNIENHDIISLRVYPTAVKQYFIW